LNEMPILRQALSLFTSKKNIVPAKKSELWNLKQ